MKKRVWIKSPNFSPGRGGRQPDVIVIHVMEGTLAGTDSWFSTKQSGVSAHYGIGLNREVHQYVAESDQAWHAGRVHLPTARLIKTRPSVNPNIFSVGVEHEGTATSVWPDTMYADSAKLVASIAAGWNIPLDRDHVIGHREIYAKKTCPGMGDVDRIVLLAGGIVKPASETHPTLRKGDRGVAVRTLQVRLVELGYLSAAQMATAPGTFGPATDRAVRMFQASRGLLDDGIVGPKSWEALGL